MKYIHSETFNSLTDDEKCILWYILNKLENSIFMEHDVEFNLFTSVKRKFIIEKIKAAESSVKEEYKDIYTSLVNKINCKDVVKTI